MANETMAMTGPQQKVVEHITKHGEVEAGHLKKYGLDLRAANNLVRLQVLTLMGGVYRLRDHKKGKKAAKAAEVEAAPESGVMPAASAPETAELADARSEAEHCGDDIKAKRGGAIPGAMHLEWKEALDPATHRFKKPEELARLFQQAGIDLHKPTVTHCQSGGRAAVMAFTLELMGADQVSNYYRSWSEWGNDPDTPVVQPPRKATARR